MNINICQVCGHIEFGIVPENCPVCFSGKEKFQLNNNIFIESSEKSPEAEIKHEPAVTIVKECGMIPESSCTDVLVRVGKTLHPMTEEHYIMFIDCYVDDIYVSRLFLSPNGVNPAVVFHLLAASGTVTIVERCNLHGYWLTKQNI